MWIGVHPLAQAMLGHPTVQAFTERSGVVHFIYTYLLDAANPELVDVLSTLRSRVASC